MDEQEKYAFLADEAPDEEQPAEEAEPVAEPEPETVETPEAPAAEVPTTPEPEEERVPLAALKAERAKRQEEQRARQELEARIREQEERQRQPPPDFRQAPEQYIQQLLSQQEQVLTQRMLGAMEAQVRESHEDYDEVFAELEEQAQENPALVNQIRNAANPALAAYKLGKQLRELKQMQDPDAYKAKIEAEVRARIEAEYKAKEEAKLKAAGALPPDLTAARASRDENVLPDDSLESILKSKR